MQNPDELFDIVDARDRVIGHATRRQVHARGRRHRAVHVLLFDNTGNLFVQKRSGTKDTFPGCHDSSVSGHLERGETYEAAALRELNEELNLEIPRRFLRRHFKIPACKETGWEFIWIYSVHGDYRPRVNRDEIESGQFLTRDQAESLPNCAPAFRRILCELRARGRFPVARGALLR